VSASAVSDVVELSVCLVLCGPGTVDKNSENWRIPHSDRVWA